MTDIDRRRGATFATLIALIALVTLAAVLTGVPPSVQFANT